MFGLSPPLQRQQEDAQYGGQYMGPMLFPLNIVENAQTPRPQLPLRNAESSLSTGPRRSVTPPGSLQTDATPAPGPPRRWLNEDVVMEEPGSVSARGGTPGQRPAQSPAVQPPPTSSLQAGYSQQQMQAPSYQDYEDVWVTVYGFTQADTPLVLQEFHRCGDILNWGTYGQPNANYLHIQYQNKHGAQRALLRNGEQLTASLIVGVKPLDARHRRAIEAYSAGPDSPLQLFRPKPVPQRPYKIELSSGQQVPQPSRSMLGKVFEYVLGV